MADTTREASRRNIHLRRRALFSPAKDWATGEKGAVLKFTCYVVNEVHGNSFPNCSGFGNARAPETLFPRSQVALGNALVFGSFASCASCSPAAAKPSFALKSVPKCNLGTRR